MCKVRNYAIYNSVNPSWYKTVKIINEKVPQKYETGFMDITNIDSHIFESYITSPISTTTNYKISWIHNMITTRVNHHENNYNGLDTYKIYKVLK